MEKEALIKLVFNNRIEEALKELVEALQEQDLKLEAILINRRLESLNRKIRLGIIDEKKETLRKIR